MRTAEDPRRELRADCSRCVGLCCVALAFARSADFAFDKAAGDPCVNLDGDDRCSIHSHLRERGFRGCTVFDCFGAGQQVTQHTFDGRGWRDDAERRREMFAVFPLMRQLHELLWYLEEALALPAAAGIHPSLRRAHADVRSLTDAPGAVIVETDIEDLRAPAADLLRDAARLTREAGPVGAGPIGAGRKRTARSRIRPGADLLGADLRGADLRGAELRGALLIAADLRDADLSRAELIGADLRDARLDGADLREAIYLTQVQVNAATGDGRTLLPPALDRPGHWS
ncbi:pentapeptide repeat-containing protein [Leifsonia sp. 21MFCrub1.1]|uniref:pentapeptide repeat-containing protein n=1 Tax=Leifsonia sp. 21MFCrub1.1 TaxID=1798223 RepID=UPI0008928D6C|nr:pentapeptide repeat-containing protein [Leifsonia sp. 21MFCrub1.1]SEB10372.1 Pentapeptide repeat-containing protein [Leifsonia sp. 21MFCrub1.1]